MVHQVISSWYGKKSAHKKNRIEKYHHQLDLNAIWTLNVYVSSTKIENFYYLVDFRIICQFVGISIEKVFAALQKSDVQYSHQLHIIRMWWWMHTDPVFKLNFSMRFESFFKSFSQRTVLNLSMLSQQTFSWLSSFSRPRFPD